MNTPANPIYSSRTRFPEGIVAEFWMPRKPSHKAIILCDGCPSLPSRHKVGEFFARKGYWVFHPRYRGTWESDGVFLKEEPSDDVSLVAHALNDGFMDIMTRTTYLLDIEAITVVGASFGGTAAMLSLRDPLITNAVALAPVIDWRAESKAEPFAFFVTLLKEGFGGAYRAHPTAWKRLQGGKFFSPTHATRQIDAGRLFVVHALDDQVVPAAPLRVFAKAIGLRPLFLRTGGHYSTRAIMERDLWKEVSAFLKS